MTDLDAFEDELRRTLIEVERTAVPSAGFEERLLSAPITRPRPHRVHVGRQLRWLPPLLAAAAVIAVVIGGAAIVTSTQSHKRQLPAPPGPSSVVTATPTQSASLTPSPSATPSPSTTVTQAKGVPVPAGFAAFDVSFIDANRGWALGNYDCNQRRCATLLHTTDGGAHWSRLSAPTGVTPVDDEGSDSGGSCGTNGNVYGPCVHQVYFADDRHGYLWSINNFYATDDGGQSWTDEHAGATQVVASGSRVYRLQNLTPHQCSVCEAHLEMADIGSNDWRVVDLGPDTMMLSGSSLATSGDAVYFLAATRTGSLSSPTYEDSGFRLARGDDTWAHVDLGRGNPNLGFAGMAAAPDDALAVAAGDRTRPQFLEITTDAGKTFGASRAMPTPPDMTGNQLVAFSARDLAYLVQTGAWDAPKTTVYASHDGGANWQAVDSAGPLQRVRVLSTTAAYRVRSDRKGVVWTTDAGRTWTSRYF